MALFTVIEEGTIESLWEEVKKPASTKRSSLGYCQGDISLCFQFEQKWISLDQKGTCEFELRGSS